MESSNGSDTNVGGIENSIKNERSSIEKDIKIALDKFSDNKDIDSAILIVEKFILGNYILRGGRKNIVKDSLRYILSDYKKLQEEFKQVDHECNRLEKIDFEKDMKIKELQKENAELKNIRYDTPYGTETIHLIPESNLIEINTQKYMIEVEPGNFVDLKQVYLDNKKLNEYKENYIPIQKIKDKIRHYQELQDNYIKKYDEINEGLQAMINVLQELIEESEE